MVLFDIAAKRVVFGGCCFICRNAMVGATGSIMREVNTTSVAELVPLLPCTSAGSGTGTSGNTANDWDPRELKD